MYSFANKWVQWGSVRLHIIHPAKCRPNPESTCWFHPQSFTKKSQKNCIVSLKLSQPSLESSHFQHTENFIQPSSSHHPAIIQPSCAGDKLPLLRPIFPAVRSMTSPRPRPMVSLSQLPKPPPRIDMPPSRPSCHVKKDGFTCSNPTKMPTYHQHPSTIVMQMSKMSGIHRGKHLWMSQKNDSRIA